jgi:hypothetical protein
MNKICCILGFTTREKDILGIMMLGVLLCFSTMMITILNFEDEMSYDVPLSQF